MNTKKILTYSLIMLIGYSCSEPSTSIIALCEKDEKGNFTLKWEIFPESDNIPVEIYASDNDSIFPPTPILTTISNNYIAVIEKGDSCGYRYYRLKVGNTSSDIITNRLFPLDSVQNFRDIGGYRTIDNKLVKWGKIFRSGDFTHMTDQDGKELRKLHLKTVIDLRPTRSTMIYQKTKDRLDAKKLYELPITSNAYDNISQRIVDGKFLRGDAVIFTQDMYRNMVENYAEAYAKLFDYMCDENNYPIVYHCFLGKDQSGIASYFLLRALNVAPEVAEDDYMLSNAGIDRSKFMHGVDNLSESRQEALTMITKTDKSFLRYAISCIRTKYGSVDQYMTNELRLTPEKRAKLQKLLLYKEGLR